VICDGNGKILKALTGLDFYKPDGSEELNDDFTITAKIDPSEVTKVILLISRNGGDGGGVDVTDVTVAESTSVEPAISLAALATTDNTDLFGKKAADLQGTLTVTEPSGENDGSISGTLKYVTGYTGFDSTLKDGNYIALKVVEDAGTATKIEAGIVVSTIGMGLVELDSDHIVVLKVSDKANQKVMVVATYADESTITKWYKLDGLTLDPAPDYTMVDGSGNPITEGFSVEGTTITLTDNVAGTLTVSNGTYDLDMGGKSLDGLAIENGAELTLSGTGTLKEVQNSGSLTNTATLTLADGAEFTNGTGGTFDKSTGSIAFDGDDISTNVEAVLLGGFATKDVTTINLTGDTSIVGKVPASQCDIEVDAINVAGASDSLITITRAVTIGLGNNTLDLGENKIKFVNVSDEDGADMTWNITGTGTITGSAGFTVGVYKGGIGKHVDKLVTDECTIANTGTAANPQRALKAWVSHAENESKNAMDQVPGNDIDLSGVQANLTVGATEGSFGEVAVESSTAVAMTVAGEEVTIGTAGSKVVLPAKYTTQKTTPAATYTSCLFTTNP